ncbi:SgcJ/EcaC family oxidoreductase [Planctomycetales bacterium 10988]|nr:SgcJ/EcaC family oxidoreductase [Planctomycetales bacterium 10988]
MFKTLRLLLASAFLILPFSATLSAEEAEVRQALREYIEAFNNKDLTALSSSWTEQGTHHDRDSGEQTKGREAIVGDIAEYLKLTPDCKLTGTIESIHFVQPDVASIKGQTIMEETEGEPIEAGFSAIMVQTEGKWMIDSVEEFSLEEESNEHPLADLAWLVGTWVEESEETKVSTTFQWTSSEAFLLRSFVVEQGEMVVQQGTQVIGWDPRSQEIRSWTFHSDGSFGDAVWLQSKNQWVINTSQTLASGEAASGTYLLKAVDNDTLSIQLIAHTIEGEPQPTSDPVTAIRVSTATSSVETEGSSE